MDGIVVQLKLSHSTQWVTPHPGVSPQGRLGQNPQTACVPQTTACLSGLDLLSVFPNASPGPSVPNKKPLSPTSPHVTPPTCLLISRTPTPSPSSHAPHLHAQSGASGGEQAPYLSCAVMTSILRLLNPTPSPCLQRSECDSQVKTPQPGLRQAWRQSASGGSGWHRLGWQVLQILVCVVGCLRQGFSM